MGMEWSKYYFFILAYTNSNSAQKEKNRRSPRKLSTIYPSSHSFSLLFTLDICYSHFYSFKVVWGLVQTRVIVYTITSEKKHEWFRDYNVRVGCSFFWLGPLSNLLPDPSAWLDSQEKKWEANRDQVPLGGLSPGPTRQQEACSQRGWPHVPTHQSVHGQPSRLALSGGQKGQRGDDWAECWWKDIEQTGSGGQVHLEEQRPSLTTGGCIQSNNSVPYPRQKANHALSSQTCI